jgi:hypothetical protein
MKMDDAIRAYMVRGVDLRAGAAMAGVSYNRFLREVQARNIVILEDDNFIEHLAALAQTVGSDVLAEAVDAISMQAAGAVSSEDG